MEFPEFRSRLFPDRDDDGLVVYDSIITTYVWMFYIIQRRQRRRITSLEDIRAHVPEVGVEIEGDHILVPSSDRDDTA